MNTLEVWICVDTEGEFGTGKDADSCREDYEDKIGSLAESAGFRLLLIHVMVPEISGEPDAVVRIAPEPPVTAKEVR